MMWAHAENEKRQSGVTRIHEKDVSSGLMMVMMMVMKM